MSDNIIRFTNGDDGVFAHVVAPSGKHYGINVEYLACDADEEWNLVGKFFRAVVEKVNAENGPFSCEDAAPTPPNCVSKSAESETQAVLSRTSETQSDDAKDAALKLAREGFIKLCR